MRATGTTRTKPAKKTPTKVAAAVVAPTTPRTAIKVLKGGRSWHGGDYQWSLPVDRGDGTWEPGAWTPEVKPKLCSRGWHLTTQPACWWGADDSVVAYLAEYDGRVDGPDPESGDDTTKIAVTRCRLLRPLTHAELAAHGVYLSGVHEAITGGINYVRGGTINDVRGGTINDVSGGTINYVSGGTINYVSGGTINYVSGGTINYVSGGTITAHASSSAVIVVRWGKPTITLRSLASCIDYRSKRPVHHLAADGQVLTLSGDGTVSQAPVTEVL